MDDRCPKAKICILELQIHTSSIRNNALRDLTLIAMMVARCARTVCF